MLILLYDQAVAGKDAVCACVWAAPLPDWGRPQSSVGRCSQSSLPGQSGRTPRSWSELCLQNKIANYDDRKSESHPHDWYPFSLFILKHFPSLPLSVSLLHSITDCCFNPFSTTASTSSGRCLFFTFIVDSLPGVGADEQPGSKRVLHHSWIILTDDLDVSGQETNISCQSVGESRTWHRVSPTCGQKMTQTFQCLMACCFGNIS